MSRTLVVATLLALSPATHAGLYYSGEVVADLPSQWRGFLPDQRLLRTLPVTAINNPLRDTYREAADRLAKKTDRTADESADFGALLLRLGNTDAALSVLRDAARKHPDHFRLAANLGTAWQVQGDLDQAMLALRQAVRLAPAELRPVEELHLKLVHLRRMEPKDSQSLDRIVDLTKLPADAAALVQRLALWLPADGRLLWLLGEIASATGDTKTAAAILDGCVTELGMSDATLRARRIALRAAADDQGKASHDSGHKPLTFRSPRPLARHTDAARLPPIRPDGVNPLPWSLLAETTLDRQQRPRFAKHVQQLDGKLTVMTGFLQPLGDLLESDSFLFIEYPVGCWFCEVPEPTSVVLIELPAGKTRALTRNLVKVQGRLKLNSTDPEGFLYTLHDAKIGEPD
ncbi:MAG: hypothetical protein U0746_18270 [Gemmataceae bacterium]